MPERRRRTKNAKMAKMTNPSTLAILATLTIFLDESRGLAFRRRAEPRVSRRLTEHPIPDVRCVFACSGTPLTHLSGLGRGYINTHPHE